MQITVGASLNPHASRVHLGRYHLVLLSSEVGTRFSSGIQFKYTCNHSMLERNVHRDGFMVRRRSTRYDYRCMTKEFEVRANIDAVSVIQTCTLKLCYRWSRCCTMLGADRKTHLHARRILRISTIHPVFDCRTVPEYCAFARLLKLYSAKH
jgi:hypothetical protein